MGGECSLVESDVVWQDGNNAWFEAERGKRGILGSRRRAWLEYSKPFSLKGKYSKLFFRVLTNF